MPMSQSFVVLGDGLWRTGEIIYVFSVVSDCSALGSIRDTVRANVCVVKTSSSNTIACIDVADTPRAEL